MKFKNILDREGARRRKLAARALTEIRMLAAANYPLAMLFDKVLAGTVDRAPGEAYPQAIARKLGLNLEQLHDFAAGIIKTGLYQSNSDTPPTTRDLVGMYRGWSAVMIECEREIAASREN